MRCRSISRIWAILGLPCTCDNGMSIYRTLLIAVLANKIRLIVYNRLYYASTICSKDETEQNTLTTLPQSFQDRQVTDTLPGAVVTCFI